MEGKNRVKKAYQQTVENMVKSAQEVVFSIRCRVLCTLFCGEIPDLGMSFYGFHRRAVEKPIFCGKSTLSPFEIVDGGEVTKFAGQPLIPITRR
jgi:hypothetical protein